MGPARVHVFLHMMTHLKELGQSSYQRVNKTIVNLIKKANTLPGEADKRRAMRQLRLSVAKSEAAWDAFDAETKQAY